MAVDDMKSMYQTGPGLSESLTQTMVKTEEKLSSKKKKKHRLE